MALTKPGQGLVLGEPRPGLWQGPSALRTDISSSAGLGFVVTGHAWPLG